MSKSLPLKDDMAFIATVGIVIAMVGFVAFLVFTTQAYRMGDTVYEDDTTQCVIIKVSDEHTVGCNDIATGKEVCRYKIDRTDDTYHNCRK